MSTHTISRLIAGWFHTSPNRVREQPKRQDAFCFSAQSPDELTRAAQLLTEGKVGVIAFNGVYGMFASATHPEAGKRILTIKARPAEKKLVLVTAPEYLPEQVDFSRAHYSPAQIVSLVRGVHALGVILPAKTNAPFHLLTHKEAQPTILAIWTEYPPLRSLFAQFRRLGGHALAGTSANRSGQRTYVDTAAAWQDFKTEVDFFVAADFAHLPPHRKQSTTVLDLTKLRPRLHRLGNVTQEEIQEALSTYQFPQLLVDAPAVRVVKP